MFFKSAEHKTFVGRATEVGFTVFVMWFGMLLVVSLFKAVGLASVDFSGGMPIMGWILNSWLQYHDLTLGQALAASPATVMTLLIIMFGAPLLEEPVFRSLPCSLASDEKGDLRPRWGVYLVLVVSFIAFGLAHGHGYFSVLLQGVGGLFLARLFFRNGPDTLVATICCMFAHSLYNISVVATDWLKS